MKGDVYTKHDGDKVVCVDFGHGKDVSTKTVFKKGKDGLIVLSQEVIGLASDFNTEEKKRKAFEL